jgi:ATP-binding cassette, subfamily B, bacterial PglK
MMTTLRQALHLLGRDQRGRWAALVAVALVASAFEMIGAAMVYVLLALVVEPSGRVELPIVGDVRALAGDLDESAFLLALVGGMAIFFVLRACIRVGVAYMQRRVAENAGARLSSRLVEGYLRWPYAMHLHRNSAQLIRNGHQAVKQLVRDVFLPMIRVSAEFVVVVGMLVLLAAVAPGATALAALVLGGAAAVLLIYVQPRLKRLGTVAHRDSRETLHIFKQSLEGLRDIKLLGRERYFAGRYRDSRLRYARARYLHSTITELPHTVMELALIGFIMGYFVVALVSGATGQETLSVLGLFAYAGFRLQPSLQQILIGLNNLKYSSAPLDDLHADLVAVERHAPTDVASEPLPFAGSIVLDSVSYRYEGADRRALCDVSLRIRCGEVLGICGPTGGGKTTLVDVITGLLCPTSGQVTVDGRDVEANLRAWQRNLGVVPQQVFLVDDTLRRNVALGVPDDRIDEDAVREAVELAQLSSFVDALPLGLDTGVGERGVRLSGGQRQRISIARALYRRPAVLVFDEGTSALDNETESVLMAALEALRGERTIIHVAHRLTTVRRSDRIALVDGGRIRGVGDFETLYRGNEHFRRLAGTIT